MKPVNKRRRGKSIVIPTTNGIESARRYREGHDPKTQCSKCGKTIWEMAEHGHYLRRISPQGEPFIGECAPSCNYHGEGSQEEALMNALNGDN